MARHTTVLLAAVQLLNHVTTVSAQSSCSSIAPSGSIRPSIASGYEYAVVATGLTKPRSLQFDSAGNLLVLEAGSGLSSHKLEDNGGTCIRVSDSKNLVEDSDLTHGLALSPDGRTVYTSTSDKVYSQDYNPDDSSVGDDTKTLIKDMEGSDHTTRTILIPRTVDGMLVVARGSTENVDPQAEDIETGISTVKAFNISGDIPDDGFVHAESGTLLGWGLRNEVGIVEHPNSGAIYGVENSVDQLERDGEDIHSDNPGEELNFLGYLNGTEVSEQGTNYGYPKCLTAWRPSEMPANEDIEVGTAFADSSDNDSSCDNTTEPRLTFQAHTAPLDMKFNDTGREGWISFHGSWNRDDPVGYSVAKVMFDGETGEPMAAKNSTDAAEQIFANQDNSACPDDCLRPVGMAFDSMGRLFVTSDSSGEIYVIMKSASANGTSDQSGSDNSGGSGSSGDDGGDSSTGAGARMSVGTGMMLMMGAAWFTSLLL